jgi:hypothetical protein
LTNARLRHLAAFNHPVEAEAEELDEHGPLQLARQEIDEHVNEHVKHDEAEFDELIAEGPSGRKRVAASDGEVEEDTRRGARARKAAKFTVAP